MLHEKRNQSASNFPNAGMHTCRLNRLEHMDVLESEEEKEEESTFIDLYRSLRVAPSDAKSCLLSMAALSKTPYTYLSIAMYGLAHSFLKINACFLRRCYLIWKRKQHAFGIFGQVKNKSFLKGSNSPQAGPLLSHARERARKRRTIRQEGVW